MSQYTQPQPQPGQPSGAGPGQFTAPNPVRNGLGTAALVLGIIGTVTGFVPFLFWLGGILGLLALILGLSGRGRAKRAEATNKGAATAGAVLGLIAMIVSVAIGVVTVNAVDDAVDEINKTVDSTAPKGGSKNSSKGKDGAAEGKSLAAGDTLIYDDDVQVTVSAPKPYSPGQFSIGHTKGNKAYTVTIAIENAGKKKFDANLVTVDARAGKDGVSAEQIYDDKAGHGFEGSILPGRKATVTFAFDAPADAENLTVEVTPGFLYDATHWELTV